MLNQNEFNQGLMQFIEASPTPFHAVAQLTNALRAAGYQALDEADSWALQPAGKYFVCRNGSSLCAFNLGTEVLEQSGLRMLGAHTDSPCLKVKPNPVMTAKGYVQLGVEIYGGMLLSPWFDRDLSLAGRVSYSDKQGSLQQALIDFRRPLLIIPSLAIHLDREVNNNRSINAQTDLPPIMMPLDAHDEPVDFKRLLLQQLLHEHPDCAAIRVLDYELSCYDSQKPAYVGLNQDFIAAARLDNLLSCYTGLMSLVHCPQPQPALLVCNDHEEVGSLSASGAQGDLLRAVLMRISDSTESFVRTMHRSMFISADNAHGVHPNFANKHDDAHGPLLNQGPVIKVNANQRYATNSQTSARFRLCCERAQVPVQSFVMRSDLACGSTIGPITAAELGVATIDVGVPTFAMHSIRELAGSKDAWLLFKAFNEFLQTKTG